MNREQRERRERYEKNIRTFRDFRVFRGLKYSGHSVLESRTANDANMEKQTNTNFCGENDNEHSR